MFCADHRCVHFADQIAKEYEKANPKPDDTAMFVKGTLGVIGAIAALAFIGSAASSGAVWDRIMVVMAVSIIAFTIYACTKSPKR